MPRIFALVVCLGSFGWGPSAAMAQSADLAALVAHVQALEATITAQASQMQAQAAQIAALQTVTGTAIGSSLNNDHAWVFETESETDIDTSLAQYDDADAASGVQTDRASPPPRVAGSMPALEAIALRPGRKAPPTRGSGPTPSPTSMGA